MFIAIISIHIYADVSYKMKSERIVFSTTRWNDTGQVMDTTSMSRVPLTLTGIELFRRMAENGFAPPPPREFRRHILSCRELKVESFKTCLHSVRWGVSL